MSLHVLKWSTFFFCINIPEVITTGSRYVRDKVCHTCAKGGESRTCYCDNICTLYNDCCFDAPAVTGSWFRNSVQFSCSPVYPSGNIYIVNECMTQWRGSTTVQSKCEIQRDFSDLSETVPVIDTFTKITYRNFYCAECNNISPYFLSPFSLNLWCGSLLSEMNNTYGNITDDLFEENMVYEGNSWGIYHWDPYLSDMAFIPCSVYPQLPKSLSFVVRSCYMDIVSTCVDGWNFQWTRHRCMFSSIHIVYDSYGGIYRNVHCAVCNYIPENDISCTPPTIRWGGGFGFSSGFPNFNVIWDFWKTCKINEVYDKESMKCRRMVCPDPDKKAVYGKCVDKGN